MKSEECTFRFRAFGDEYQQCSRPHGTLYCKRDNCPRPSIDWPEPEADAGGREAITAILETRTDDSLAISDAIEAGTKDGYLWDVSSVSCVMGLQAEVERLTEHATVARQRELLEACMATVSPAREAEIRAELARDEAPDAP